MKINIGLINKFVSALCLIALLIAGYSLALGRGRAMPQKTDYRAVRHIVLTYKDQTRILRTIHVNELEALSEAVGAMELKPGLAPVLPDEELATLTFWNARGKFEDKYIFLEHSVMRTQGLAAPWHYVLINDHGLLNLIRQIISETPEYTAPSSTTPEDTLP